MGNLVRYHRNLSYPSHRLQIGLLLVTLLHLYGQSRALCETASEKERCMLGLMITQPDSQHLRLIADLLIRLATNDGIRPDDFLSPKQSNSLLSAFPLQCRESQTIVELEKLFDDWFDEDDTQV